MRARCLVALLTVALVTSGSLAGSERISYQAEERRADQVLAALNALAERPVAFAPDLLDQRRHERLISLHLQAADRSTLLQSLAFALDCWWCVDGEGTLLTGSPQLPTIGELSVRSYHTPFRDREDLIQPVQQCMRPWLGGMTGLDYHPATGRWVATLDSRGHQQLRLLLTSLERPVPRIPALVPDPALPPVDRLTAGEVRVQSWTELQTALARSAGVSVCIHARLRARPFPEELRLPVMRVTELPKALAASRIEAGFRTGVLCCDTRPVDLREHPGQRRELAVLRSGRQDVLGMDLLIGRIRRHVQPEWWRQPGAALIGLPDQDRLIVSCDTDGLRLLLDQMQQWEHLDEP